jgi:hypothetical protein
MGNPLLIVGFVAVAVLFTLLGWPLFTGEVYTANDLAAFHLPTRVFYARCLAAGHSFLWFPHEFTGFYLHGEGQAGLYHPMNWILYRMFPVNAAFNLELLRSHAFALPGMYLFLRRWKLERTASLLGALLAAFSSFNLLHYIHINMVGVLAHLPWLLLATDVAVRERGPARRALATLGIVILIASQLLLGHPQAVWISLMAQGAYALCLVGCAGRYAALLRLAFAAALGLGVGSVQVVPTLEALAGSTRVSAAEGYSSALALAPAELMQLLAPYLLERRVLGPMTWELGAYAGALPLTFVVWLLLRRGELKALGPLALGACLASALALLLALGDLGGVYRLQRSLPFLDLFRAPARYLSLFQLALALATAVGFADLLRCAARRQRAPWRWLWPLVVLPCASTAIAAAALVLAGRDDSGLHLASLPLVAAGPVLFVVAASLVAAAARGSRVALIAIVAFAALDAGVYGLTHVWQNPPRKIGSLADAGHLPEEALEHRLLHGAPVLTIDGVRLATGYAALPPARKLDFARGGGGSNEDDRLVAALRAAGVGWAYGAPVPEPLPRVRLVTDVLVTDDPNRDIARVDVTRTALVADAISPPLPIGDAGSRRGSARLTREEPGKVWIRTSAPTRQLLIFSESYHEGWRATVDGSRCDVLRVYGDFMGCVVPAGSREVQFEFDPPSLRRARWASALALAVALLWCSAECVGARRGVVAAS